MSKITKLGLGIVAFEGTEHIKNIAYELRNSVDEIVVCLQERSYTGIDIDKFDIDEINRCLDAQLIDKVVWFKFTEADLEQKRNELAALRLEEDANAAPDQPGRRYHIEDAPRLLECDKRNQILDILEADGCSHALVIDSDEYYNKEDFDSTKKYIDETDGVAVTYCQYVNYWQDYRHYIVWNKKTFVPFIAEISYRFDFKSSVEFAVDRTRVYGMKEGSDYFVIKWDSLHMHHFSWVRLDISKKVASWSSKGYYNDDALKFIVDKYYAWKENDNAYVMFRVPLRPMCVVKYDRPYVNPHYPLYETNLTEYDV